MPNQKGGKGYKRGKKRGGREIKRDYDIADGVHHYATVINRLGDNKLKVKLDTNAELVAIIPGKLYKKVWCNKDDTVVVMYDGISCELVDKVTKQEEKREASSAMMKGDGYVFDVFSMLNADEGGDDEESKLEKITDTLKSVRMEKSDEGSSGKPSSSALERKQRDKERTLQRQRDEIRTFDGEGRRTVAPITKPNTIKEESSDDDDIDIDDI